MFFWSVLMPSRIIKFGPEKAILGWLSKGKVYKFSEMITTGQLLEEKVGRLMGLN